MGALRKLTKLMTLTLSLVFCGAAHAYTEPECSTWNGVLLSENVFFLDPSVEKSGQRALLDAGDQWGPFWIQAQLEGNELKFENKMPGLGLPFTIYHVEVNWIGREGRELSDALQSFPAPAACAPLSLFPGQVSRSIEIVRPKTSENLRLQVKVWAVPF